MPGLGRERIEMVLTIMYYVLQLTKISNYGVAYNYFDKFTISYKSIDLQYYYIIVDI